MCKCGHDLEHHGDRAVFPACEGGDLRVLEPLLRQAEGSDFTWIATPRIHPKEVCECKGYTSV